MPTLDWLDRDQAIQRADSVPYRLLESVSSHGDPNAGNLLIQGDNLDALKALLPFYRGQVKCIYIDPPYNTRSAFEHYDDNLEHSQWLSMMYPRLLILRELLAEQGSIWVSIDDNEGHYLKVLMDEVFGRRNFVSNVIWQKVFSPKSTARHLSDMHDHILLYAKEIESWDRNLLPRDEGHNRSYKNPDNDPRGPWTSGDLSARNYYSLGQYEITTPKGRVIPGPPKGMYWRFSKERFLDLDKDGRIWWGKDRDNQPRLKRFLSEVREGVVPQTLWFHNEVGNTQEAKKEVLAVLPNVPDVFQTTKPERLLRRVFEIASSVGDLVLDSFLGSGSAAAVAHKMNRRYIGIEMGEHALSLCLPRLEKVVQGEQGGISQAVGWSGGGGFKFMRLGEPVFDELGAINPKVRFGTLASFIWLQETGVPSDGNFKSPLLGLHEGTSYFLLFNGILGDKRPNGGNVLTGPVLQTLRKLQRDKGPAIVYGESCRLGASRLQEARVTFKHIPYDVRAR